MRARTLKTFLLASLLVTATGAQAGWREDATQFDVNRLAQLDAARAKGLSDAAYASPGDQAIIHSVLDVAGTGISADALMGTWRCRSIKLGGITPSIIYTWFTCRISQYNGQLIFEKSTGSQRTYGVLYPESGGFVYLGASSVKDEPPHRYSGNRASIGMPSTPDDQIGLLTAIGNGRVRLELPYPIQESTFDVIELKR